MKNVIVSKTGGGGNALADTCPVYQQLTGPTLTPLDSSETLKLLQLNVHSRILAFFQRWQTNMLQIILQYLAGYFINITNQYWLEGHHPPSLLLLLHKER